MRSKLYLTLLVKKVKEWYESNDPEWIKSEERDKLLCAMTLYLKIKSRRKKERRFWVRHIFTQEQRLAQGASDNLVIEMLIHDEEMYFDFFRMDFEAFNNLLTLIEPKITKQTTHLRIPIPAKTRLEICLRFLASGDITKSVGFLFRVSPNTVSKIVSEVCDAIWEVLSDIVFPKFSEMMWKEKALEFKTQWNFPNCIGAIDGKHCYCEAPPNTGSAFWNYKDSFSIILLAVADANAMFTMVDIGAEGRNSDGGVFMRSEMSEALINNTLNIPPPVPIESDGPALPYVLVGDEAFGLSSYMMRPYPVRAPLTLEKKVYNYRHSRARRIIECAFGILVNRWLIYKKKVSATPDNYIKYIKASVCLHNYLVARDLLKSLPNRNYSTLSTQENQMEIEENEPVQQSTNLSRNGVVTRDAFLKYFCSEAGEIEGQWEKAVINDF